MRKAAISLESYLDFIVGQIENLKSVEFGKRLDVIDRVAVELELAQHVTHGSQSLEHVGQIGEKIVGQVESLQVSRVLEKRRTQRTHVVGGESERGEIGEHARPLGLELGEIVAHEIERAQTVESSELSKELVDVFGLEVELPQAELEQTLAHPLERARLNSVKVLLDDAQQAKRFDRAKRVRRQAFELILADDEIANLEILERVVGDLFESVAFDEECVDDWWRCP